MARIAACTNQGKRRSNQDSHGFGVQETILGETVMGVVCDGVGGLSSGEVASSTVVRAVKQWFDGTFQDALAGDGGLGGVDSQSVMDSLDGLVASANVSIRRYASAHGGKMGTTLSCLLCAGGRFLAVQVGDSRIYHVTSRSARLVTEDQTLAAREVLHGLITRDEARNSEKRSVLLQAIGSQEAILPIFYEGTYEPGDLFVLMSDGAWHQQEAPGITQTFSPLVAEGEERLEAACRRVVEKDLADGETDNLTILVVGPEA